jgi:AcrR family transcriptional regulator
MSPTRRERIRETTFAEIKATAWKQITEQGAPSLSLRAIAREIGMTAPGLYRYYSSRDDLVTALISEAFETFAQFLEAAREALPVVDHVGRYRAVCLAYFQWAVANPARYTLIFEAPVPGYQMGADAYPAAQRGFLALQTVIGEAFVAGKIHPQAAIGDLEPGLLARYEALSQMGMPYPPQVTHLALKTWSEMHGVTSLYLSGYLPGFLAEQVESFVRRTVEKLVEMLGLE